MIQGSEQKTGYISSLAIQHVFSGFIELIKVLTLLSVQEKLIIVQERFKLIQQSCVFQHIETTCQPF